MFKNKLTPQNTSPSGKVNWQELDEDDAPEGGQAKGP